MVVESLTRLEQPTGLSDYVFLARLAQLGSESRYLARPRAAGPGRRCAIRLLPAHGSDDDAHALVSTLERQARARHSNLVRVWEAGDVDGACFVVTDFIRGCSLRTLRERCATYDSPLTPGMAVHMVREVCRGLGHLHETAGRAHGEISGEHVLLDWVGGVHVALPWLSAWLPGTSDVERRRAYADDAAQCVELVEHMLGPALPPTLAHALAPFAAQANAQANVCEALREVLSAWLRGHAPGIDQDACAKFVCDTIGPLERREREERLRESVGADPDARVWPSEVDATADLRPGTVIAGRYRLGRLLGEGGMGSVHAAEHIKVGRKLAIKVLSAEWMQSRAVIRRLREEARAASAVGHPNIVDVFDAGELPDGRPYLVMEHLPGRSLYQHIFERGPLPVLEVARVAREVARAIRAAHRAGIIHRDLKPDNVMVGTRDDAEFVKVLDFGIAASMTASALRLTTPGTLLGTPDYMAPEQALSAEPSAAFDVYAMGVLMYEALCGETPFATSDVAELLRRKTSEDAPHVTSRRPDIPEAVAALVMRCLARQPSDRPTTSEMIDALAPFTQEAGVRSSHEWSQASATWVGHAPLATSSSAPWPQVRARAPALWPWALVALVFGASLSGGLASWTREPALRAYAHVRAWKAPESLVDKAPLQPVSQDMAGVSSGGSTEPERVQASPPARATKPTETSTCARARVHAEAAAARRAWQAVLSATQGRCGRTPMLVALRVRALFELKQWERCVHAGQRSRDASVRELAAACELRLARRNGGL